MAKPKDDEKQTVVAAQNDALLRWSNDQAQRNKLVDELLAAEKKESDAVKNAKAAAGFKNTKDLLLERNGWTKPALSIVLTLEKLNPAERAKTCRQLMKVITDREYVFPDLFDNGAIGVGSNDAPGETAGFDNTGEGQRRGGAKAEPNKPAEPEAAKPREIPTLSLEDARKNLEAELAKRDGKRGPEPKSLKEARAAVAMAEALEAEKAKQGGDTAASEAEAEKSNVVPLHRQMAEEHAKGEAHIREQAAKLAADREAKENGTAPSTAAAPPPPPPPPADDEDEDEAGEASGSFPDGAPVVGAHPERRAPDFRIG